MALESLQDLYLEQLRDLHSAERQMIDALPMMIGRASHPELRRGLEAHLRQTEEQLARLEKIGKRIGKELTGHRCVGMEGLLEEGEDLMAKRADTDVLDAALIAAAQRVEHYEMAGYGCARTYATLLGLDDDAALLQRTLDEEGDTDKRLTALAERVVNIEALVGEEGMASRDVRRAVGGPESEAR